MTVIRDKQNRPFLVKGTRTKMVYVTDCWDSETEIRLVAWLNALDHFRIFNAKGGVMPCEVLRQQHVGAILASYYFERRHLELEHNIFDPDPMLFLGNAAPRRSENEKGIGTAFVFAELEGSVYYFGTFGPELSWVKPHIRCFYELSIDYNNAKTVFRSRFLPEVVSHWLEGREHVFQRLMKVEEIPDPQMDRIFSVDSFGNIKLPLVLADRDVKTMLGKRQGEICINGLTKEVKIAKNLGDAKSGELILAPGSSRRGLGPEDFGIDLYCQEGDAAELFALAGRKPKPGDEFRLNF